MENNGKILEFKPKPKVAVDSSQVQILINPDLIPTKRLAFFELGWQMTNETKFQLVVEDEE
jgi:hypothetical protein